MAKPPFLVDIAELNRQPGVRRRFEQTGPAPESYALDSAEVVASRIGLDLWLEVAGQELIASGHVAIEWRGPCRRCLEVQDGSTVVEVREIFQHHPVDGETYPLSDDQVDLEPMIRETVLLNLPVAPLCREDCAGPDPDRFPTTVETESDTVIEPLPDPRWGALAQLKLDMAPDE